MTLLQIVTLIRTLLPYLKEMQPAIKEIIEFFRSLKQNAPVRVGDDHLAVTRAENELHTDLISAGCSPEQATSLIESIRGG